MLPSEFVDWELVLVVGRHAYEVAEGDGWSHIAGVMVGQDLSERIVQTRPPAPQFSLGKSFPGFGPTGRHPPGDDAEDTSDTRLRHPGCALAGGDRSADPDDDPCVGAPGSAEGGPERVRVAR